MNRIFLDAAPNEGGGDPTAMVLKAIEGVKEGQKDMAKKSDLEPIAIKAAADAVLPVANELKSLSTQVQKLDAAAGQMNLKGENKTSLMGDLTKGIKENLSGETLKKFSVGSPNAADLLLKTAGTMTVADDLLAGSAVTTYNLNLQQIPGRLVNFRNLVQVIPSGTGIFQFPRERAKEGSIADQTAGNKKSLINARFEMVTVNTTYLAGLAPVAKQMMQDLPFLQSFMPQFMLREYLFAEDSKFYATLILAATGSAVVPGSPNDIDQIMGLVANLRSANYQPNGIVLNPADVYKIFINKGATSGDYTLPPGVTLSDSGIIRIFGIPVYETTFIPEDKVIVGDWTKAGIVQTEGLSVQTDDRGDNFDNNTVTWKVEARVELAVLQPAAFVYADLGNVT
jgi:HK97 family phage major capsid protein